MGKYNKYYVTSLLFLYILKVYGSLILSKCGLISDDVWVYIHYIGTCILLCSFFHLLKDKMHSIVYSLGMSIFVSRLITQVFSGGYEYWHEMISVILLTCIFYFVTKKLKKWKE